MLGAIIGDVVGSRFEFNHGPKPTKNFELLTDECEFTDDTIMTVALMDWCLHAPLKDSYSVEEYLRKWGRKYPSSYGGRFSAWLYSNNPKPYGSYGNGACMRISPIAYYAQSSRELIFLTDLVTSVTHNHFQGIKAARALACAIYMAKEGESKEEILNIASSHYPEMEEYSYEDLVKNYKFNETAMGTCPQAIYCFLISNSFEDCLRTSISIGGDSDTLCAISCAIAEAYYKDLPKELANEVFYKLPKEMQSIINEFYNLYVRGIRIRKLDPEEEEQ